MTVTVLKQSQRLLVFLSFKWDCWRDVVLLWRIYFCPSASGAHLVNRVFVTALNCAFCIYLVMRWILQTCEKQPSCLIYCGILLRLQLTLCKSSSRIIHFWYAILSCELAKTPYTYALVRFR